MARGQAGRFPAFGHEVVGVGAPDFFAVVDGVRGDGEGGAGGKGVAEDLDRLGVWVVWARGGDETGEAEGRRAVNAHGFVDDGLYVWEVFDRVVRRDRAGGDVGCVELFLKFGDHVRCSDYPVQESAGCVAGGVAARNQLGERFGGKFLAAKRFALCVFALHQSGKEIDSIRRVFETVFDTGYGNAGKILDSLDALAEERIGQVFGIRFELWKAAQGATDFTPSVQHLNGWGSLGWRIRRLSNLSKVPFVLEHSKRRTKCQITDDVKGEIVEPVQGIDGSIAARSLVREFCPFSEEQLEVGVDVLFELAD